MRQTLDLPVGLSMPLILRRANDMMGLPNDDGTPLPEVLHSGVLARRNAFGSLFKAKQKSGAGATAASDAPRNFDLSRDVERCFQHSHGGWRHCGSVRRPVLDNGQGSYGRS